MTEAVPFTHPRYGHFGNRQDAYRRIHDPVTVEWLGAPVEFYPNALHGKIIEESFDTMDALMKDQAGWSEKAKAAILTEMYPLWRDEWRDPDTQPALSEDEFWSRTRLGSISCGEEGWFSMLFEVEGNLFSDHSIDVMGSLEKGVEDVTLLG